MNINPSELEKFRKDFLDIVAPLQDKYDVTITLGNITYDEHEFSSRLSVKNGRDSEEIERHDFDANVWKFEHLGFRPGMYRRVFIGTNGGRFAIIGFNTRAKKYPLTIVDITDGSVKRAPEGFVREIVNEYYVENIIGRIDE